MEGVPTKRQRRVRGDPWNPSRGLGTPKKRAKEKPHDVKGQLSARKEQ